MRFSLNESTATAYVIGKYGDGKFLVPDSGMVDDLFCVFSRLGAMVVTEPFVVSAVSHYAEGSLMPLLVNKLIFGLVPERAPFILRPILRTVFKKLESVIIEPRLKIHASLVSPALTILEPSYAFPAIVR